MAQFSWFTFHSFCFCFSSIKLEGKTIKVESDFFTLVCVPMPGNPECEVFVNPLLGGILPEILYLPYRDLLLLDLH